MDKGDVQVDRVYRKELEYIVNTEFGRPRKRHGIQDGDSSLKHQPTRDEEIEQVEEVFVGGFLSVDDMMDDLDNILNHKENPRNIDNVIFNENPAIDATQNVAETFVSTSAPSKQKRSIENVKTTNEVSASNEYMNKKKQDDLDAKLVVHQKNSNKPVLNIALTDTDTKNNVFEQESSGVKEPMPQIHDTMSKKNVEPPRSDVNDSMMDVSPP